jgi:hypothetical protein
MSALKVGDVISPIKGKKSSRENNIEKLEKAEIIQIRKPIYSKTEITIKIISGMITFHGRYHTKNNEVIVYSDAFELTSPREPQYDPW